jgi:hypothetical protein
MTLPLLLSAALAGLAPVSPVYPPPVVTSVGNLLLVDQDRPDPPPCSPTISWLNETQLTVLRASSRPLSLFSAVDGERYSYCASSSIQFTVVYLDAGDDVVCSGRVELGIPQQDAVQYTHLEIRPGNSYEFLRWRNDPKPSNQQWSRLVCMNADGRAEVQPGELERAKSLRIHATITPRYSGLATAELRMILQP